MSAAAAQKHASALFFFYFYRISISMVVMPIVLSFVIQTFVAHRKRQESTAKQRKNMNPFSHGIPEQFIKFYQDDYRDAEESFEDYQIRAYPGTANISLWAITGSEMYTKNDVKLVKEGQERSKRRQSVLDLSKERFSISSKASKKAYFVTTKGSSNFKSKKSTHLDTASPIIKRKKGFMLKKEISSMNRRELESLYEKAIEDLEKERQERERSGEILDQLVEERLDEVSVGASSNATSE